MATRLQSGRGYTATLNRPLAQLLSGHAPEYILRHASKVPVFFPFGTSIKIVGLRAGSRSPLLSLENTANYLRWFSVAGSCRRLFGLRSRRRLRVDLYRERSTDRARRIRIDGHELPNHPIGSSMDYNSFAESFEPFSLLLEPWALLQPSGCMHSLGFSPLSSAGDSFRRRKGEAWSKLSAIGRTGAIGTRRREEVYPRAM